MNRKEIKLDKEIKADEAKKLMKLRSSSGFVLLFSLLISSILLATGLGISRVILREIFLASLGRESSVAFFAADTGADCARHWQTKGSFDLDLTSPIPSRIIFCNEQPIKDGVDGPLKVTSTAKQLNVIAGGLDSTTFSFFTKSQSVTSGTKVSKLLPCALVKITLSGGDPNNYDLYPPSTMVINSKGYNNCDLTSPQTLERTLEYTISLI